MDYKNTIVSADDTANTLQDDEQEFDSSMVLYNIKNRLCVHKTMIVGHRGGFMGPENSIKTFRNALLH